MRRRLVPRPRQARLDRPVDIRARLIFLAIIAGGLLFIAFSTYSEIPAAGGAPKSVPPLLFLGAASPIALGLEFVNRFRGAAKAVASVIDAHSPDPPVAVV